MLVPRRLSATESSSPEGLLGRLIRAFPARSMAEADAEVAVDLRPNDTAIVPAERQAPVNRSWFERFDNWLWRLEQREREAYLADAGDITELEARMRTLEHRRSRSGYPL